MEKFVVKEYEDKCGSEHKKYFKISFINAFQHLPASLAWLFDNLDTQDQKNI